MSTKSLVIAQKYTPDKYDKVYLRLERIMEHPRQVSRFRSELAKAIARGFPIDYKYIQTAYIQTDPPSVYWVSVFRVIIISLELCWISAQTSISRIAMV